MSRNNSPFKSLHTQLDTAARYIDTDTDEFEILKHPERMHEANFTVELDDGSTERFCAYRAQFNDARGPYKGGIRYHPAVTPR